MPFGKAKKFHADEMTENAAYYKPPCSTSPRILMYPNDITSGGFKNNFCNFI